jgi:hypothetical protein
MRLQICAADGVDLCIPNCMRVHWTSATARWGMLPYVLVQCGFCHYWVLQDRRRKQGCSGLSLDMGSLLRRVCRTYWIRRIRRDVDATPSGSDNLLQSRLLWCRLVSMISQTFKRHHG